MESEFWGVLIEPGILYSQTVSKTFRLSMAALNEHPVSSKRSMVYAVVDEAEFVLCALAPGRVEQQPLAHVFREGQNIGFRVTENAVYLTGNFVEQAPSLHAAALPDGEDVQSAEPQHLCSEEKNDSLQPPESIQAVLSDNTQTENEPSQENTVGEGVDELEGTGKKIRHGQTVELRIGVRYKKGNKMHRKKPKTKTIVLGSGKLDQEIENELVGMREGGQKKITSIVSGTEREFSVSVVSLK